MPSHRRQQLLTLVPRPLRPLVAALYRSVLGLSEWVSAAIRFGPRAVVSGYPSSMRETHAIHAGLRRFADRSGASEQTDPVLRRNVHRLEKGLISRPRRDVFAADYIGETVQRVADAAASTDGQSAELAWARDVLHEYFIATTSTPDIDRARRHFESLAWEQSTTSTAPLVPYVRDLSVEAPVSCDALLELAIRRRSVRWFRDVPVPRAALDAAFAVAAQSPSACNRQPFEFRVFDQPERVKRIAEIPGGAAGFTDCIPVLVAVIGRLDAFFSDRDRHVIYIDGSLAAMSFMLALESLGLSSYALNTPAAESAEIGLARELNLEPYERPIMLIAVGYPDPTGLVPRSQKKPLEVLRRYAP